MAKSSYAFILEIGNKINKPVVKTIEKIDDKTSSVTKRSKAKVRAGKTTRKSVVTTIQANDIKGNKKPRFLRNIQKTCPHEQQTLRGSNKIFWQVTCCNCDKVLYMHYFNETKMRMKQLCKIQEEGFQPPQSESRRSNCASKQSQMKGPASLLPSMVDHV